MPSLVEEAPSPGRLLLISNRLPITIQRSDDGTYSFSMSSGGLVTGLSGLSKTTSFQWYGWPGLEVPDAEAGPMITRLQDEYNAHPVFVDDELADRHYNGFASKPSPCVPFPDMRFFSVTRGTNDYQPLKTPSSGLSSTTTPVRSPSTSLPGPPTER